MVVVRAWTVRMTARYGPAVWDQEKKVWLSWEMALSRSVHGPKKDWLLNTPVWDESSADKALEWEFGNWWPAWAVKANLVDVRPCDFEDHKWVFKVDLDLNLVCLDPCEDPRVFCDEGGRYVFPACQSIPDLDCMKLEIPVKPEWVFHTEEDWWLELVPE